MNFAVPAAFWWAALAVPIVVFYILKIRMRRIPVSTIMFWQQVFEEKQPRSYEVIAMSADGSGPSGRFFVCN